MCKKTLGAKWWWFTNESKEDEHEHNKGRLCQDLKANTPKVEKQLRYAQPCSSGKSGGGWAVQGGCAQCYKTA